MRARGVAPLESAGPDDLAYMDNPPTREALAATRAGRLPRRRRASPPKCRRGTVALVTPQPYRAFAQVLALLFPRRHAAGLRCSATGVSPGSFVHPTARLEHGVTVDPGAVIGPQRRDRRRHA